MQNLTQDKDESFISFIAELAGIAGQDEAAATNNLTIEISERKFEFDQDKKNSDLFYIECNVCTVPDDKKSANALLQAAMELNFQGYNGWSPTLILADEGNEICSLATFSLSQITASQLHTKILDYTEVLQTTETQLQKKSQTSSKANIGSNTGQSLLQRKLLGGL